MAGAVSMSLYGFEDVARRLATLNDDMKTKTAWSATSAAASVIRDQAKANASAKMHPGIGNLVGNIATVRRTPPVNGAYTYSVGVRAGPHRRRGVKRATHLKKAGYGGISTTYPNDPYYWFMLEFGYTHEGVKKRPFIKLPFIVPAMLTKRSEAFQAMSDRIARRLRSVS